MARVSLEQYQAGLNLASLGAAVQHALRRGLPLTVLGADTPVRDEGHIVEIALARPETIHVEVPCEAEIVRDPPGDGPGKWHVRLRLAGETIRVGNGFLNGEAAEFAARQEASKRGYKVVGASYVPDSRVLTLDRGRVDC